MAERQQRIYVKIPADRLGALIGKGGEVKREIAERLGVRITVDSDNSLVIIEPETPGAGYVNVMKAANIVRAIAAGFPPDKAMRLAEDDQILVTVDLKQLVGDAPNHLRRVRGRIIGERGRARRTLEEMTGTYINVGDYTVAIIGDYERAMAAKRAVEMLVEGRMHSTVYKYLDQVLREIKRREHLRLWAEDEFYPEARR